MGSRQVKRQRAQTRANTRLLQGSSDTKEKEGNTAFPPGGIPTGHNLDKIAMTTHGPARA